MSLSLICCLLIANSCKKSTNEEVKQQGNSISEAVKKFIFGASQPKDGMIAIQSTKQACAIIPQDQQAFSGYIGASFFVNKDENKKTLVSNFKIDGNVIPYNNDTYYPGYWLQSNSGGNDGWLKGIFGKKIRIDLDGSYSYRTNIIDSSFYVPKEMIFESDFLQTRQLDATVNHTFTWIPDTENPTGKIYVAVMYESYESNILDSQMPDSSYTQALLEVPDNGTYTITPSQLSDLPTNSIVSITLARGNYASLVDPVTGTNTFVYSLSESNTSSTIKIIR